MMSTSPKAHDSPVVSFDDEPLVLVDSADTAMGYLDKAKAHDGQGVLHRAFSLFVFNSDGRLLLQQRSGQKRLWPLYWSNSCCSHPRRGESLAQAVRRRALEELACDAPMHFTHKFEYQAPYQDVGSEHELCHVFVGVFDGEVVVNHNEVSNISWWTPEALDDALKNPSHKQPFTPWLRLEWAALRAHHWPQVQALISQAAQSRSHQKG